MGFLKELAAHNIDIDEYMTHQNEFMQYCRQRLESESKKMSAREYAEKDQSLNKMEKFINNIERQRLQKRIKELSSLSSL
jgi:ATPase subunit of ABC transporter with duplicated ATPase domains